MWHKCKGNNSALVLTRAEEEKFGEFDKEKREGEDQECELQIGQSFVKLVF